ncbi:MAG: DUF1127 domain-containing protein [Rhodobacteraceae bacterium]|nr:DUF1127 domain-containing protein [Paracoccaceae bacterium]
MAVTHVNIAGAGVPVLGHVVSALARMVENHPRMRQIERLNKTSDAELECRGVTRQEVIQHIFRDRYYI